MQGLVFAQSVNKTNRHDATGAFLPGAQAFTAEHALGRPILLDDHNDKQAVFEALEDASDLGVVAYFGHGTRSSLPSAEIYWRDLVTLAPLIKRAARADCQVVLYACSAGELGCFANQLAKLMHNEITVWGHTCVGHSFTNPYVTYFPYLSSPWLVEPDGPRWRKWHRLIKSGSRIWARYPFMTQNELEIEVDQSPDR
jgi:hypothetical protein